MSHINQTLAHRELISKHNTLAYLSDIGRVSVRKSHGRYVVNAENFETSHTNRMEFKTLRGAMIAADELKRGWL